MNILVVDDDKEIVDSIAIFLSGEGYSVFKAYDGIYALEILSCKDRGQFYVFPEYYALIDGKDVKKVKSFLNNIGFVYNNKITERYACNGGIL